MLDLLIKNGLVVDGSGNPGFYGSVGVDGDTLHVFRGDSSGLEAARVFDASSKVVCPGFIDVHAHSGLMILAEPNTTRRYGRESPRNWWEWMAILTPHSLPTRISWHFSN